MFFMELIKKAQKLGLFWRKMILLAVLAVLAVLMLVFISYAFKQRMANLSQTGLSENLQLPAFSQEIGQSMDTLQEFVEEVATSTVGLTATSADESAAPEVPTE